MGDKQRKLKDKASRAYSEGDLKGALKLYQRVVFEDSSELQCQLKIGDIYRKLGNFDSAVQEYGPVARAYAEDGLLLKAIAVCKMILGVDAHHTGTQAMLADLYSKRRGPAAAATPADSGPPVTLEGMGIQAPSTGVTPGSDYGMIDFGSSDGLVAPSAPESAPSAWPTSTATPDTPAVSASTPSGWPTSAPSQADSAAPPAASWPVTGAPPAAAWPVASTSASDDADDEDVPKIVVGSPIEDSVLDITMGAAIDAEEVDNTEGELESLLEQLSDDDDGEGEVEIELDEPIAARAATKSAAAQAASGKTPEETWDGVIRIEDVDGAQPDNGAVIELTNPVEATGIEESLGGLARPQIPLFSELPKNAFIELLVQMEMREMEPGEFVIREGDIGDSFFVVASGRVRVMRRGSDGQDVDLAILTDGAFFGEMALLQDGARTASVVVEDDSQIFEISKEVLDRVVEQFPSVATVLRNFYRQRLLSTAMATHPIFRPFSPDERRSLMELFKSRNFDEGEVLLEEGKKGTGLFILLYGALEVASTNEGEPRVLASLGPGDMFGEMSLLTGQPTVASVRAITDCFVLRLSKKKFDEVIMTHPQILELVALVSDERASINDALLGDEQAFTAGAVLV